MTRLRSLLTTVVNISMLSYDFTLYTEKVNKYNPNSDTKSWMHDVSTLIYSFIHRTPRTWGLSPYVWYSFPHPWSQLEYQWNLFSTFHLPMARSGHFAVKLVPRNYHCIDVSDDKPSKLLSGGIMLTCKRRKTVIYDTKISFEFLKPTTKDNQSSVLKDLNEGDHG